MGRWNPTTRALRYDRDRVVKAIRRRVAELREQGEAERAAEWEAVAEFVEAGYENAREAARALMLELEYPGVPR